MNGKNLNHSIKKLVVGSPPEFSLLLQSPRLEYEIGDNIPFTVTFSNPRQLQILCMSVKLVRKITDYSNPVEKDYLDVVEIYVGRKSKEHQYSVCGKFTGTKVKVVSYSSSKLRVVYSIVCEVITKCSSNVTTIGEIDVVVIDSKEETLDKGDSFQLKNTSSDPPDYSQLSSRTNSLLSFESLPPHYGDI